MKSISIIIKINDLKSFDVCFNSILNQSLGFENLELFLLNKSDDNNLNFYTKNYDNINVIESIDDIKTMNSEYVMLFDSNVEFFQDSFEFLFNEISLNKFDIVSAKFQDFSKNKYFEFDDELDLDIEADDINNKYFLVENQPSIFTKIFKKDIIFNNTFLSNLNYFDFDFVFIINYLIKSKRVKVTNKSICKFHYSDNGLTKKYLIDLNNNLNNYFDILINHNCILNFDFLENVWIKMFCLSNISDHDKVDVLMSSKLSFRKYKMNQVKPKNQFEYFIKLINSKKYFNAVKLSKLLSLKYPESNNQLIDIIKNQEIYSVFFDWDMKPGGTGSAVINKSNNLSRLGYKINLLSVDKIKNYKYIKNHFYESGMLLNEVNVVNIYEYYCDKNTFTDNIVKGYIDKNESYIIEEIQNDDNSITYIYYDKNNESIKSREELFIEGALVYRNDFIKNVREYFTLDGFKYLSRVEKNNKAKYYLNDRISSSTVEFTIFNQMLCYFINEYCDTFNNKPLVICENTQSGFNINRLDPNNFIKLGSIHGSPFIIDYNGEKQINPKISHFKILDDLKSLVLLTDSAKQDVMSEFEYDHFISIPNFISDECLEFDPIEKEFNKIKIFSRISPEKNLSDAIKAFDIVSKVHNDAILEIFGREDLFGNNATELSKLKSLIKSLNLEDKVIFKGFIEDVTEETRTALLTLLVSDHEGLPLSLLESMANATPVVSYDIEYGPKDVITNGVDGIIVNHGDYEALAENIINLLNDPQKAIDMGINARDKIKNNFSASVVCKKWEDLFADVYAQTQIDDYEHYLEGQNYKKLNKKFNKLKKEKNNVKRENKKLNEKNKDLEEFKRNVLNSSSWRITKPLRILMSFFKRE